MKKTVILLLLTVILSNAYSQERATYGDFSYSGDTLFFNNKIFTPGDTVHLGTGSGINKQFLFVSEQTSNMKKHKGMQVPIQWANTFLIYKRIDIVDKKSYGLKINFVEPIFGQSLGEEKTEWMISLTNALKSGEILFN